MAGLDFVAWSRAWLAARPKTGYEAVFDRSAPTPPMTIMDKSPNANAYWRANPDEARANGISVGWPPGVLVLASIVGGAVVLHAIFGGRRR